jgi:hypothetical protein
MKFVNKQLAYKLKEKGFDRPCFGFYNPIQDELQLYCANNKDVTYKNILTSVYKNKVLVDAPTIEQVLKWLREEKDFMVFPVYSKNTSRWYCEIINADSLESYKLPLSDSYEDAAIAGIEYVINNLI